MTAQTETTGFPLDWNEWRKERIQPSRTYDGREHWQILANHYWAQA
jgi:hypothetical protein